MWWCTLTYFTVADLRGGFRVSDPPFTIKLLIIWQHFPMNYIKLADLNVKFETFLPGPPEETLTSTESHPFRECGMHKYCD